MPRCDGLSVRFENALYALNASQKRDCEPTKGVCGTRLMVIQLAMSKIDRDQEHRPSNRGGLPHDFLEAENVSLRLLLEQAEIDAQGLLAQAGIDAREREVSDKLQKLILEELHHRIKNTLAIVSAIVSQSLGNVKGAEHAQDAIEGRLLALGRAHDLLSAGKMEQRRSSVRSSAAPPRPLTTRMRRNSRLPGPDIRIDLGRRDRHRDDAQRALHQHHEVRSTVGA